LCRSPASGGTPALAGGFLLLLLIGLAIPDLAPPATEPPAVELLRGRIVAFLPPGDDVTAPDVQILILAGPQRGQTIDGYLQGPSGQEDLPRYDVGDEVIVNASLEPDSVFISVADLYRVPVLGLLLALFAIAVTVVGGWRGVRSLIALALTLAVIVKIVVPLILAGWNPAWVRDRGRHRGDDRHLPADRGARPQTVAAAIGTFAALALTALLALGLRHWRASPRCAARRTRATSGDRHHRHRSRWADPGAIIFGAPDLDDVTVTQAAVVTELHDANPVVARFALAGRAMNVGRSHIAATVNTLVLAYVGASAAARAVRGGRQDPLLTASTEAVAVEVVRRSWAPSGSSRPFR
jgi:hypothetical protein